jgi:hypothetical protein
VAGIVTKTVAGIVDPSLKVEMKPIVDPAPTIAEAHKQLLLSATNGTMNKELFTPEMQARIFPDLAKMAQQFLSGLGKLESFTLVRLDEKDGNKIRLYKATMGGQDLNMYVATDKNGKIAGFSLTPG